MTPTVAPATVPALEPHDRLTREEFERRYDAMPHLKKAELLKGVVHMPSPVRMQRHGAPHARLVGWLFVYQTATPGVELGDNATVRLGPEDEPQPDALLMVSQDRGGQAAVDGDDYISGPPELAAEVASSSTSYDLHVKREVYEQHGIREYLIWRVDDRAIDWLTLRDGRYQLLAPGPDGIQRSEVFPGLWLDAEALIVGDGSRIMQVLQEGVASPEHRAFVQQLAQRSGDG
jgi:Uma2 family endonuclease